MKIAHVAIATPGKAGLYETTRDLVAAERALAADARIVDPAPTRFHPGKDDRGVPIAPLEWAAEADVLVDHSGLHVPELRDLDKPIVYVAHGRPYASFWAERSGKPPVLSYQYQCGRDPRYRAVVTFWPEHVPNLEALWGDVPVYVVHPPADLNAWSPGPTSYDFDGRGGSPNVVIADMWRDDLDPFPAMTAFAVFARTFRDARLHCYGLPADRKGIDVLLRVLRERGNLGVAAGWVKGLLHVYRAADLVVTPHRIATRTVREAMATGCQVVSGRDADPFDAHAFAESMAERLVAPKDTRGEAERSFDARESARQFLEVVA